MVAVLLDGMPHSLELPPDCVSVAQATSYAKHELGAIWADACTPRSMQRPTMTRFDCESLGHFAERHGVVSKMRLFLSAKGWQPGGSVATDASLLSLDPVTRNGAAPITDELPASLLRCGLLKLRAFTPAHAQVTVDLPDGRSIVLPVAEAPHGADACVLVAALLGCKPSALRLWPDDGGEPLGETAEVIPGARFRAKPIVQPGPGAVEFYVKTLTGKTITLHIAPDSSVVEAKQAITDLEGIPVDQQRLIKDGRQLDDPRTLASYGITDGTVLRLVLRLRGGMFELSPGRAGNFQELGLAADEEQVAAITAAGGVPVEIVLPYGSTVLLCCEKEDGPQAVLAALRERLGAAAAEAVLSADVDEMSDVAAMREMLRQAQAALRARQP